MELYIVRHAWAAEHDDTRWPNDDLRPLTDDGRERFTRVVEKLSAGGVTPQLIAASPLTRCVETAELLSAGVEGKPEVVVLDYLRPGSDLAGLSQWTTLQMQSHKRIAWVGHAPDVGALTAALIGRPDSLIRFAKGAAACVCCDGPPSPGSGILHWLVTAKILGC